MGEGAAEDEAETAERGADVAATERGRLVEDADSSAAE